MMNQRICGNVARIFRQPHHIIGSYQHSIHVSISIGIRRQHWLGSHLGTAADSAILLLLLYGFQFGATAVLNCVCPCATSKL